ncbi:ATP-binding protein [Streptomyces sp. NPDC023723]|uniref:ATP-binding protein n=1 Tax=Streptomyces sp. NPDC023723 TaxID=3154323 RepID=UPI0033FB7E20
MTKTDNSTGTTFDMRFTSTPRGARLARRLAAVRLDAWGIPYGTRPHDDIVLIVAELTTNAVRHGHVPGRDFRLRMAADTRTVRVEVTDARAERPPRRASDVGGDDETGRGLLLVAHLAAHWDWHPRPDGPGKTVWAEYALAPDSGTCGVGDPDFPALEGPVLDDDEIETTLRDMGGTETPARAKSTWRAREATEAQAVEAALERDPDLAARLRTLEDRADVITDLAEARETARQIATVRRGAAVAAGILPEDTVR